MSRKVFTSQKISLFLGGEEVRVQALVSPYGAKYVYDEDDLPDAARSLLSSEVQASYKGIPVRCRFVRETNSAGTIYSLRFLHPSSLLVRQVEKDVATSGIPSPWMRGLPRLDTAAKHLPVPVLAVAMVGSSTVYLNVKNFTLGGVMLEYSGEGIADLTVGKRIEFDVVTNGGDKFPEISGVVTHVSAELADVMGAGRFQFGVRFAGMAPATELKYRGMIREHCQGLKGEAGAG
jgi:hypothetical protein